MNPVMGGRHGSASVTAPPPGSSSMSQLMNGGQKNPFGPNVNGYLGLPQIGNPAQLRGNVPPKIPSRNTSPKGKGDAHKGDGKGSGNGGGGKR